MVDKIEIKTLNIGGKSVTVSADGVWYKASEITKALGDNHLYSATKCLTELGIKGLSEIYSVDDKNTEFKFLNIEQIKKHWDARWEEIYNDRNRSRNVFASIKGSIVKLRALVPDQNEVVTKPINKTYFSADASVNIIMEELIKLSTRENGEANIEKLTREKKELEDRIAELEGLLKSKTSQFELMSTQVTLSSNKYEELKAISLKAIADRDRLQVERDELFRFKQNIQKMM